MTGDEYNFVLLARRRKELGLSQQEMADDLGVIRLTISRLETGEGASYSLVKRFAARVSVPLSDVLTDLQIRQAA